MDEFILQSSYYIGYIIAWIFLSFILLNMFDGMIQNLYKRNTFIVLGVPLLFGVIAIIIQFLKNAKLKVINNGEL